MVNQCKPNYIPLFYDLFKECAYDSMDGVSIILGYISIIFWINVLFPQLWENYCRKSVESLSYSFLTIWFLGDSTNLIGAILTNQLPFQIYLAAYFVLMDLLTVIQCTYYNYIYDPNQHPRYQYYECPTLLISLIPRRIHYNHILKRKLIYSIILIFIIAIVLYFQFYDLSPLINNPPILMISVKEQAYNIGIIISWTCTVLYIASRVPQILKNYKRQSVDGLSFNLFLFAFFGNLTYTLSILLRAKFQLSILYPSLPFILGSAGTMWADAILFYQFALYPTPNTPLLPTTSTPLSRSSTIDGKTSPQPWDIIEDHKITIEEDGFYSETNSYLPSFSDDNNITSTPIQLKIHHNINPNYKTTS